MCNSLARHICIFVFSLCFASFGALIAHAEDPPTNDVVQPPSIFTQFATQWDDSTWTAPGGKGDFMRPLDDAGWRARMRALRTIVAGGERSIPGAVAALGDERAPVRILAAQAMGYLGPSVPREALENAAAGDADPAVRLYAIDALGMRGGEASHAFLEKRLKSESNRDAKMHIRYALERKGEPVNPAVIESLAGYDLTSMNSAEVGKPAPDFALATFDGQTVRLADFREKQAVVLVFIYGDT
jgi:hypothetical protein